MIVDHHAVIGSILRKLFEAEELDVSDAANGADGVQKAQKVRPDASTTAVPRRVDHLTPKPVSFDQFSVIAFANFKSTLIV